MARASEMRLFFIQPDEPFGPEEINRLLLLAIRLGASQVAFQPYTGSRRACDRTLQGALAGLFDERRRVRPATKVWRCRRFLLRDMYRLSTRSCAAMGEVAHRLQDTLDNVAAYGKAADECLRSIVFHERTCVLIVPPSAESVIRESGFEYSLDPPMTY